MRVQRVSLISPLVGEVGAEGAATEVSAEHRAFDLFSLLAFLHTGPEDKPRRGEGQS